MPEPPETLKRKISRIYRHSLTRFLVLAAVGFSFDITLLTLLTEFTSMPRIANVSIAFWVTYALNFVLNRYLAFDAANRRIQGQLAKYIPQVLGDFLLTLAGVEFFVWLGLPLTLARIGAGATNAIFNYVLYRFWTFRGGRNA